MTMAAHRVPTADELRAVTAIFRAYMACNHAGDPLHWEVSPGHLVEPTAMGHLAEAGRTAWRQLYLPERFWSAMIECGEDAAYVYRYWITNESEALS